jgi:GAF domain-containing protein
VEAQASELWSSILLLYREGTHVRHAAAPRLSERFRRAIDGSPIGERAGSCGTAAYRRETVIVEDVTTDPLWEDYRELAAAEGLRACWSTPIFDAQRTLLGTFALYFRQPSRSAASGRRRLCARAASVSCRSTTPSGTSSSSSPSRPTAASGSSR